jgi:RNA polymerase sigma factor (sigma-70 family)
LAAEPSIGRASLVEAPRVAPHAAATHGLYERHAAKIQSYCHHQLGSREEAEDAVQTTFMNAFRALGRGIVPEAESAWLFKIAENVCLSRRRSSWRRGKIESPSDFDVIEEVVPGPNRQRDELIGIEDALASMPEQQRRAILLREWQGLSYREVAEELEISQSAVETLIFRARRSLAQGLEQPDTIKPKRKSFRRALHVIDLGTIVAAVKTLLAGSAAVKATAAAVAVTAAAGTIATVSPTVEPRSPRLATAPKYVAPAPAAAKAATPAAALSFSPAARHAGEQSPKSAVAAPKQAKQPTAGHDVAPAYKAPAPATPVAAAPVSPQPAEPAPPAPKAEPQQEPAAQPVAAEPRPVEKNADEGRNERHTEGAAPVAPTAAPAPVPPTESTGGGGRSDDSTGGVIPPNSDTQPAPAHEPPAPAPAHSPGVTPGRGAPTAIAPAPSASPAPVPIVSEPVAPAAPAPTQNNPRGR